MQQFHCLSLRVPWRRLQWWSRHNMVKYGEYVYWYDIPLYIYIWMYTIVRSRSSHWVWHFVVGVFQHGMVRFSPRIWWRWATGPELEENLQKLWASWLVVIVLKPVSAFSMLLRSREGGPFHIQWSEVCNHQKPNPQPLTPPRKLKIHKTDTDVSIPPKKCLQVEGHGTWNIAYPTLQVEGC